MLVGESCKGISSLGGVFSYDSITMYVLNNCKCPPNMLYVSISYIYSRGPLSR